MWLQVFHCYWDWCACEQYLWYWPCLPCKSNLKLALESRNRLSYVFASLILVKNLVDLFWLNLIFIEFTLIQFLKFFIHITFGWKVPYKNQNLLKKNKKKSDQSSIFPPKLDWILIFIFEKRLNHTSHTAQIYCSICFWQDVLLLLLSFSLFWIFVFTYQISIFAFYRLS